MLEIHLRCYRLRSFHGTEVGRAKRIHSTSLSTDFADDSESFNRKMLINALSFSSLAFVHLFRMKNGRELYVFMVDDATVVRCVRHDMVRWVFLCALHFSISFGIHSRFCVVRPMRECARGRWCDRVRAATPVKLPKGKQITDTHTHRSVFCARVVHLMFISLAMRRQHTT